MFNRVPKFDTRPGTCEIGEPVTEGNVTSIPYTVTFYPIKFPPGVWYYKKVKADPNSPTVKAFPGTKNWDHFKYTRVFPWDDVYWWKARYRRTLNWVKKHVG